MSMSDRYKHPISRRFTGRPLGVENFNLEIRESWIFTIYGQNNSSKTTTLRLNLVAFSRDIRRCLWHGIIYIEYFTYMKYADFFLYMLYLIYGLLVILIGYVVLNIFRQDRRYGSTLTCPDYGSAFKRPIITIRDGSLEKSIYPYGLVQCPKCKKLH